MRLRAAIDRIMVGVSTMPSIVFFHRPATTLRCSAQSALLLERSRSLVANARALLVFQRERVNSVAQRDKITREVVQNSNERLRRSAQALYDEWKRTERRYGRLVDNYRAP